MALTRNELHLILGVIIPNMEDGFEIKTRKGEMLRINPNWECCQEFAELLRTEIQNQLNKKPHPVPGYN